jgi:hypothetical protein
MTIYRSTAACLMAAGVATGCLSAVVAHAETGTAVTKRTELAICCRATCHRGCAERHSPTGRRICLAGAHRLELARGASDGAGGSARHAVLLVQIQRPNLQHQSDRVANLPRQGRDLSRHEQSARLPGVIPNDPSWGYDATPRYNYLIPAPACDMAQSNGPVPWVNLDETR